MKRVLLAAYIIAGPGGILLGAYELYRYVQRRRARREVVAEMKRHGAAMPRVEVRA